MPLTGFFLDSGATLLYLHHGTPVEVMMAADTNVRTHEDAFRDSKLCKELFSRYFEGDTWTQLQEMIQHYEKVETNLAAYSAVYRYGKQGNAFSDPGVGEHTMYWDTCFRILFLHEWKLVAGIAFHPEAQMLTIWQIQGLPGKHAQLSVLWWQRLLVAFLMSVVRSVGYYEEVRILPARRLPSYPIEYRDDPQTKKDLRTRLTTHYDGTARSLGFVYDDEMRVWRSRLRAG